VPTEPAQKSAQSEPQLRTIFSKSRSSGFATLQERARKKEGQQRLGHSEPADIKAAAGGEGEKLNKAGEISFFPKEERGDTPSPKR